MVFMGLQNVQRVDMIPLGAAHSSTSNLSWTRNGSNRDLKKT